MDTKKCISSPIVQQETRDTPDILHRTRINSINFLLLMGPRRTYFIKSRLIKNGRFKETVL